jgi:hypothetical protein
MPTTLSSTGSVGSLAGASIATLAGANLKSDTDEAIYTVAAGKLLVCEGVLNLCKTKTGSGTTPGLGLKVGTTVVAPAYANAGIDVINGVTKINKTFAATEGQVVYLIKTASGSLTHTADVDIIGVLRDV